MRLPKTWLQDYVDFNVTDEEFIERMMWRGFELEGVEKELKDVSGVITGKILSMEKHPNADKLTVCQVDLGGKQAQAVANHLKYLKLMNDLFLEVNPIPVKAAMNMMGLNVGPTRLPLYDMSAANAAILRGSLQEAGLL